MLEGHVFYACVAGVDALAIAADIEFDIAGNGPTYVSIMKTGRWVS